jgi:hypothetical protein
LEHCLQRKCRHHVLFCSHILNTPIIILLNASLTAAKILLWPNHCPSKVFKGDNFLLAIGTVLIKGKEKNNCAEEEEGTTVFVFY